MTVRTTVRNVISLLPQDFWTLAQCKEWLRARIDEGANCPCCRQFAKRYARRIHHTMARTLIYAEQRHRGEFFHLATLDGQQGVRQADFPKLTYWGLVERHPTKPLYRVTDAGREWIYGRTQVAEYAYVYDGVCQGLSDDLVSIQQCLGKAFDYNELMGRDFDA